MPAPPVELGRWLAEQHRDRARTEPGAVALIDYAETLRAGQWSFRSALVRHAQVAPASSSALYELIRRTDAALAPTRRAGERTTVTLVGADAIRDRIAGASVNGSPAGAPDDPVDARAVDLAHAMVAMPDAEDGLLSGYRSVIDIDDAEAGAAQIYTVALLLDEIADALVGWAQDPQAGRPEELVRDRGARAFTRLAALDVPRQTRPPGAGRT